MHAFVSRKQIYKPLQQIITVQLPSYYMVRKHSGGDKMLCRYQGMVLFSVTH